MQGMNYIKFLSPSVCRTERQTLEQIVNRSNRSAIASLGY